MSSTKHDCRLTAFALSGLAFLVMSAQAFQPPARTVHAGEGPERLPLDKDFGKEKEGLDAFQALYKKSSPGVTGADEALLDQAAKWFAYRLTHTEYQDRIGSKGMHELVNEAKETILDPRSREGVNAAQQQFMDAYDKRLILRLAEVVKNPRPIARVNAARLLAQLAVTGQEEATEVLIDVINDPKENDGVKKFALKGLGEFFALSKAGEPVNFKNKPREMRAIAALLDYLNRKPALGADAAPREWQALSLVRKDAIAALGQTRYPAKTVMDEKKKTSTVERPTALTLLRIARRAGAVVEPSMSERVAAAIGICQLQSKLCPEYQVDYAVSQLGQFLVEFLAAYNGKQGKEEWKVHAARLATALEELKEDAAAGPAEAFVGKFVAQAKGLLEVVIEGKTPGPDVTKLIAHLEANPPAGASVYRNMPESKIESTEKAADDTEKDKNTTDK
jgi:hypothetical protein